MKNKATIDVSFRERVRRYVRNSILANGHRHGAMNATTDGARRAAEDVVDDILTEYRLVRRKP